MYRTRLAHAEASVERMRKSLGAAASARLAALNELEKVKRLAREAGLDLGKSEGFDT
jgi:hypothetical protein